MPRTVDQGVCLRHWDWSETSQTVSILTRTHGVVRGLAKGSKREKSPFSGGIEIATLGELVFIPKSGALATLTAWDLQELFPGVRQTTFGFFASMYMLDLAHHFVQEGDPHPIVFDTLIVALRELADAPTTPPGSRFYATLRMQWTCLHEAGLQPTLDRAADSGEPLPDLPSYGLSAPLGGLIQDPGVSPGAGVFRVRAETVALLRRLNPGPGSQGDLPPELGGSVERAARLLGVYIHHALGRSMPSAEALFGRDLRG